MLWSSLFVGWEGWSETEGGRERGGTEGGREGMGQRRPCVSGVKVVDR